MQKFFRRFLACMLTVVMLLTNVNIGSAAGTAGDQDIYQVITYGQEPESESTKEEKAAAGRSTQKTDSTAGNTQEPDTAAGSAKESGSIAGNTQEPDSTSENTKESASTSENTAGSGSDTTNQEESSAQSQNTEETSTQSENTKESNTSEQNTENTDKENKNTEGTDSTDNTSSTDTGNVTEGSRKKAVIFRSSHPSTNHSVTMPDVTSHYFLLQKNSKKVSAASGTNLKVVSGAKAVSKYIYETYKDGKRYNFTPRFTSKTKVSVSGGKGGGVALKTVKKSSRDRFGDVYSAVNKGVIEDKVYNLEKCSTDPAATYTNVGTWYDYSSGRTYAIDMKMTVTGYKFPKASIRKQLANQELKAPYVGFRNNTIGINVMGTDYVQARFDFYYSGTQTAVSGLRGVIQYCDIDAQQGVDFGSGFEKIIMFNTKNTKLQYNKTGLISGSLGYVSSRVNEDLTKNDVNTTAMGLFSGSSVNCRWTVARCDHKDTGGDAKYAVKSGYGIPAESSNADSTSYYWSNSTGFLGLRADVGLAPMPDNIEKRIYSGVINGDKSDTGKKYLGLADRNDTFTYVLYTSAPTPSNINKAKYTSFKFTDIIDSALDVKEIRVYADEAVSNDFQTAGIKYTNVTSDFTVSKKTDSSNRTSVTVTAKAASLSKSDFYGRTYYVHIQVQVKSDEALNKIGKSIQDWYQKDEAMTEKVSDAGSCRGSVMIDNRGAIYVENNQGSTSEKNSNYTASRIPMILKVKKLDSSSGKPVQGVTFGLFGGADVENPQEAKPLYTAVTGEDGIAVFKPGESLTFYNKEYGDGPYCVKEISVPDTYRNVWNTSESRKWAYKIDTLQTEALFTSSVQTTLSEERICTNPNRKIPEGVIKVYKKSQDTGAYLSGAQFMLSQWSETAGKYEELSLLKESTEKGKPVKESAVKESTGGESETDESTDEPDKVVYINETKIVNTMDNLGRYKITEKKAPKGCVLTGQEWIFTFSAAVKDDGSDLIYENTSDGEKQTGALTYSNPLQKSRLTILKKDETAAAVSGAQFTVTAAEDIYAPWDVAEDGTPAAGAKPLIAKGAAADRMTTDEEGKAVSTEDAELYIGNYLVEETKGVLNHVKSEEIYKVNLTYSAEQETAVTEYTLNVANQLMKPSFAVSKLADRTTDKEGGAVDFDEAKGRYTEEKKAGTYKPQETADYTIRVTNTGNVRLYNIKLTDEMDHVNEKYGQALSQYADTENAAFAVSENGTYKTTIGESISGKYFEDSKQILILSELAVGDSVDVHFMVPLKEDARDAWQLENYVYGSAQYDDNGEHSEGEKLHLIEVPTEDLLDEDGNSLVEDKDFINIPAIPLVKAAKIADKTTGAALKGGRYEGTRKEGTYNREDPLDYTITVTNAGTADLYELIVEDTMDEDLLAVLNKDSIAFADGTYRTKNGAQVQAVRVKEKEKTGTLVLKLDSLAAKDSLELHLTATVKSDAKKGSGLKNTVKVTALYETVNEDGEREKVNVPQTPEMTDHDEIKTQVPERKKAKTTKTTTKKKSDKRRTTASSAKTGDSARIGFYAALIVAAALCTAGILLIKKKK